METKMLNNEISNECVGWCERCGDPLYDQDAMTVVRSARDNEYKYHATCKVFDRTPDEESEE